MLQVPEPLLMPLWPILAESDLPDQLLDVPPIARDERPCGKRSYPLRLIFITIVLV
jgi:hypothetical protein